MIKKVIVKLILNFFSKLGYSLISKKDFKYIKKLREKERELSLLQLYPEYASKYMNYRTTSKSQLHQDLFVLMYLDFKVNGYFVEFGATNGVYLSNTWLLEKEFGWTGILAEPATIWHDELKCNRRSIIEKRCIWSISDENLIFREAHSISSLEGFGEEDQLSKLRKRGKQYEVKTISLTDMLQQNNAPEIIDYLSIDTEGSEYEILKTFDFKRYKIRVITVEHNFTSIRDKIYELLIKKGYKRLHPEISLFDDWYVLMKN